MQCETLIPITKYLYSIWQKKEKVFISLCNNQQTNTKMSKYNLGFTSKGLIDNQEIKMAVDCIKFHQNLIAQTGDDWELSINGFDVANTKRHIYSILRTDTSNMSDKQMRFLMIKMFDQAIKDKDAYCYIVDIADETHTDIPWTYKANGEIYGDERIRQVSVSRFYDIVSGQKDC